MMLLDEFRNAFKGQALSAIWQGHGSAIFLEFGRLRPSSAQTKFPGSTQGDYTVMIEWSWRIEDERSILCGSWSDEKVLEQVFSSLIGKLATDISVFGRLPELSIGLSGGIDVTSFMTAEGQPMWAIFDRASTRDRTRSIAVHDGRIIESYD